MWVMREMPHHLLVKLEYRRNVARDEKAKLVDVIRNDELVEPSFDEAWRFRRRLKQLLA